VGFLVNFLSWFFIANPDDTGTVHQNSLHVIKFHC